jgi:hypothetical protein
VLTIFRSAEEFLNLLFRQARAAGLFFPDLVRDGVVAGKDRLMQLRIADASIGMDDAKFSVIGV